MLHSRLRWLLIGSLVVMARGLHRIRSLRLNNDNGKALLTASALISALALHATQPSSETCPLHHQLALLVGSELIDDTMEKSAMHPLAPSLEEYIRIDLTTWNSSEFKSNFLQSNALHDTLNGKGMIETFQVFQHKTDNDLYSIVRFGDRVNGYPGLVHGGISSLVIDSLYGWTLLANKLPFAFTANLTLNYSTTDCRKPVLANTTVVVKSKVVKLEGRKIYMEGVMLDSNGEILIESTTLFITQSK